MNFPLRTLYQNCMNVLIRLQLMVLLVPSLCFSQASLRDVPNFYASSEEKEEVIVNSSSLISSNRNLEPLVKLNFTPSVYFEDGDDLWGGSIGLSLPLARTGQSVHYLGLEVTYLEIDEDLRTNIDYKQEEWLLLLNYQWFTPSLANGHIQPYLSAGVGNLIVDINSSLKSPPVVLLKDRDSFNPALSLMLGTEILFNEHFGLTFGYRFLSAFDIRMRDQLYNVTRDNFYQHGVRVGTVISF
jgi:opacity protein-like surface antigen